MTEPKKTRLAVIGLGMAIKPHLEALAQLGDEIEVSGVYNRSREKAEAVTERYGWPVFESLEAIAADPTTDGVLLATPPDQRCVIMTMMADAGKHILMEKPIERTLDAAEEIVGICERNGVRLGIVFQHRFREGAIRLRRLIEAGELGELAVVRAEIPWWRGQDYYDAPGRGTLQRDGGGVLISQAIHVLDLMLSLTGPVETVQAFTATSRMHRMETEDFAAAGLRFCSGAVGSIVATTATFPGETERLTIDGTKGNACLEGGCLTVKWHDGRSELVGRLAETGGGADPMAFPCDWHRDLISDFASAIRDGREPAVSGRDALRVQALIDAMMRSAKQGRQVAVVAI